MIEGAGGMITDWQGQPLGLASDGRVLAAGDAGLHAGASARRRDGQGRNRLAAGRGRGTLSCRWRERHGRWPCERSLRSLILSVAVIWPRRSARQRRRTPVVHIGHAIAMYGEPKYRPDFTHFDYVNPDAPEGRD